MRQHFLAHILLLVTIFFVNTLFAIPLETRIKNGHQVHISQARYYTYFICGNTMCGGTILTRNRVITAGHCVNQCTASQATVIVGLNKLSEISTATKYKISQIKKHPKYNVTDPYSYDVAILSISTNMTFTALVGRIKYANIIPKPKSIVEVYGYGMTNTDPNTSAQTLQTTKMEVDRILKSDILTKAVTTSVLPGDSGGPAVYNGELVGVISAILYNQTIRNTVFNVLVAIGDPEINTFISNNL